MKITLNNDEVRQALLNAVSEKTNGTFGNVLEENSYFVITSSKGEIEDIESVEFTVNF